MKRSIGDLLLLGALALALGGCAAPPANPDTEPLEDKVYRTGSHIPVRDSAAAAQTSDRQVIDDMRRNSSTVTNVGGGGR